jgi:sugar/nucleoside kinase (ribokinase family)
MLDIITIGSATRDAFFHGLEFGYHDDDIHMKGKEGMCLPLGAKMRAKDVVFSTGGAGTNAAVTFARQSLKVAPFIRVGDDVSGKEVRAILEQEHVDTSLIQADPSLPTSYSVILMAKKAERTILVYKGASENLSAQETNWTEIEASWIYMNSISGNEEIMRHVADIKKEKGIKLMWNPGTKDLSLGLEKLKPYLSVVDVFMANKDETAELLGIPYYDEDKIFSALDDIIPGIAIMTKGPEGVVVSDGKTVYSAGIFPEKALADRTGAGDAFGSGFLFGYMNKGIEEGIRVGSANGTSVLEHIGAKTGILSQKGLKDSRWSTLTINKRSL